MTRIVFLLCIMAIHALQTEEIYPRDAKDGNYANAIKAERTWKMNKKNFGYFVVAALMKALLFIKLALAKLAFLSNIAVVISKLSLLFAIAPTISKYFSGISKMLRLKPLGNGYYHYPGYDDHGNYIT